MADYLVTGGAGFIGSALTRALIREGHVVVVIDNLSTGFRENVPEGAHFIEGNVQDPAVYERIPRNPYRAIYHIAGQSSGEISFDDPVYDLQTNTQSTLLLLTYARKTGCRRTLYASSMSVYGDQPDEPVRESAPCRPKSFYGVGKLASEHYLRIYKDFGIQSTALRLFNVYGPGQNMANLRQGMVSIFLAMALDTGRVHVKGSPERYRDFVYIDDVVRAFIECERNPASHGKIYNVAFGKRTMVGELLETMTRCLPKRPDVEFRGSTPGDQMGIFADVGLVQEEVGFKARTPLAEGLAVMVDWALRRKQGAP
jgi:UDP-glucose 4-epimerase